MVTHLFGGAPVGPDDWYVVSNATLWMALAVLSIFALFVLGTRGRALVPSRTQSVAEVLYGFVYKMIDDVTGHDGLRYFPMVFTIFCFVLFTNYLGLIPMSFTATSHIAVSAVLGFGVFFAVTILGFVRNGPAFLGMFWLKEAPLLLRPVIALIEIISYFVRPVSHSVRLAGNVMAGHTVIKVFATFAAVLLVSPLSLLGVVAIYALEVLVAGIQAYVFTIMTCVYLRDAVNPHH